MKKNALSLMIAACLLLPLAILHSADLKPTTAAQLIRGDMTAKNADLRIYGSLGLTCGCKQVADVFDAIAITNNLTINVVNKGPATTGVKFKVTVFNCLSNSEVTFTEITSADLSPTSSDGLKNYVNHKMITMAASDANPLVIKKSFGARIEVEPLTTGISDPKPANNKYVIKDCASHNYDSNLN